jgi:inositol oxygenase
MAFYDEPQWAVVGDTFPVGCKPQKDIVFSKWSFADNPDTKHPVYSTDDGIYTECCGLDNLLMSWGHDEFLYQVLLNAKTTLPETALYIIR